MEVQATGMDEKSDSHLTSAAAFVEGGIQDACDDACSICLEDFCDSDPSAVTSCKHEFHLQCILEWCQRSSQCPMCWQPISLKDPTSQELLEAVEHERKLRFTPPRNAAIFHHPAFGEFEFQNLPVGANDSELEERIIQHLAAAAMGRSHYMARREGQRSRSTSQGRPQFLVFSTNSNASPTSPVSSSPDQGGLDNGPARATSANPSPPLSGGEPSQGISQLLPAQSEQSVASPSGSSVRASSQSRVSTSSQNSAGQSSPINQDSAGPSELQSLSESLKSRLTAVSSRYKESITKSTRGWKERLFSRNASMADISSEVKREVNAGIASVSRLMERLEARENTRVAGSASNNMADCLEARENTRVAGLASNNMADSVTEPDNQRNAEIRASTPSNDRNNSPSCAAHSGQD